MPWGGFIPPIPAVTDNPNTTTPAQTVASAFGGGMPKKVIEPKQAVNKKLDAWIDVDIVESVIADRNAIEIKWLAEVLAEVKVRNPKTGRYLKSDRFLDQIRRIQDNGRYKEVSSYSIED